jgi:hypothetical protein
MITPEQAREAFAVLGLDPTADADLVELAYWHHVDVCRATLLGSPSWRERMAELNQARALLSHIAPSPNATLTDGDAARPMLAGAPRMAAAFLPPLALMVFIVLTRTLGWDRGAIAAGGFAVLALSAFVGLAVVTLLGRPAPQPAPQETNPYRLLRVLPSADQSLMTIAYRHALRVASARNDAALLDALEAAYARVGTPAARTAYDLRTAETDALMLAQPAPPAVPAVAPPKRGLALARSGARSWLARAMGALPRVRRTGATRPRPVASWETIDAEDGVPSPPRTAAEAPAPSVGTLRVLDEEREVVTVVLRDTMVYSIGSDMQCDVRLPPADDVAGEHARLTVRRGRVLFHHLAAGSDSYINGERAVWAVLEPGDTVRMGSYRCQYLAAESRSAPHLRDVPRE